MRRESYNIIAKVLEGHHAPPTHTHTHTHTHNGEREMEKGAGPIVETERLLSWVCYVCVCVKMSVMMKAAMPSVLSRWKLGRNVTCVYVRVCAFDGDGT